MDNEPAARQPRVPLAPSVIVLLVAFGLLLAAVWWGGMRGAVVFLLTALSLAMLCVPALRRREGWLFYFVFVAVVVIILRVLARHAP